MSIAFTIYKPGNLASFGHEKKKIEIQDISLDAIRIKVEFKASYWM